jgi:citrate lyase subunit beta / citryl-CoA lyase
MLRRAQLFVPANDQRKIRKSTSLGADSVILDLEDAVPQGEKSRARDLLEGLVRELDWGKSEVCVRINKTGLGYSKEDLALVRKLEKVATLVLPKAEKIPIDVQKTGKNLIPLIETPLGLIRIEDLMKRRGVKGVSFGAADFANSLGGRTEAYSQNIFVKTRIVVTASAYGVDAIDCVYFDLQDSDGFRKEALQSKDLGYVGKQVVHPSQLMIAKELFTPSREEIESARKLVEIYEMSAKQKVGAIRMNDKLIDAVHYRRAKSVLEVADGKLENSR